MAINGIIVQHTCGFLLYTLLLFTQAPSSILVWFDGTIIDIISTILLTMYYTVVMLGYDWWLCMVINISVQYNGEFLPDIILLTQDYYHWETWLNTMLLLLLIIINDTLARSLEPVVTECK